MSVTDEWINKKWYVCVCVCIYIHTHTQWNIIQPQKGNKIPTHATTWMNLEDIMLSERSIALCYAK